GGAALVTADAHTELGRLVAEYPGIFILVPPEDSVSLKEALLSALSANGAELGKNTVAREYAERFLSKDIVLLEFEGMLFSLK
ncbi:MAG: hypothetical protein FWF95_01010, partial [Syntrophorhabdaceae bacterium]|nr:hypothetical protein [Syntrophorhabdaceae bacterium]